MAAGGVESPAAEPFQVSREEWESFRAESSALADYIQQEQAAAQEAQQRAYQEQLEELAWEDPAAYAKAIAEQAIATHVQPLAQELEQRAYEAALGEAEDRAADILDELEVPEDIHQEVVDRANELINERALWQVLGPHGITVAQINEAANSSNPEWQQWAAQTAEWATNAANQLIAGKEQAARAALEMAAREVQHGSEAEAHIAAGGSVADMVFGGGPVRGRASSPGDYREGGSVSGRMFGG